jgi:hypothetical protein
MVAKLTRLTHKIAIQLQVVAEECTICSSRSRPTPETFGYTLESFKTSVYCLTNHSYKECCRQLITITILPQKIRSVLGSTTVTRGIYDSFKALIVHTYNIQHQ